MDDQLQLPLSTTEMLHIRRLSFHKKALQQKGSQEYSTVYMIEH
jgi:hypothetical protein